MHKVSIVVWAATLFLVFLLAGKTLEQVLVAGQIAFLGFVLGMIGGKVASAFNSHRSVRRIR